MTKKTGNLDFTPPSAPMRLKPEAPVRAAAKTWHDLREEKNPTNEDIARSLIVLGTSYKALNRSYKAPNRQVLPGYESAFDVPVPIEFLKLIVARLYGTQDHAHDDTAYLDEWNKNETITRDEWNEEQQRRRRERVVAWQDRVNKFLEEKPGASIREACRELDVPLRVRSQLKRPHRS